MNKELYKFDDAIKFRTKRQMRTKYDKLFKTGKF